MTSSWPQIAKLKVNFWYFFTVKSYEICQTGYKCFTLIGAQFLGKFVLQVFAQYEKYIFAKIEKKYCQYKFLFLFYFYFNFILPSWLLCNLKTLDNFTEATGRKSQ